MDHSLHSRAFATRLFLPLVLKFSGASSPVGVGSVNLSAWRRIDVTLPATRDSGIETSGRGWTGFLRLVSSPETNLGNRSHGRAGGLREAVCPTAGRCSARSESPCCLITSQAADLGRLLWITCPLSRGGLDLARRLAGADAPLGPCNQNADGLQPSETCEDAESGPAFFFPFLILFLLLFFFPIWKMCI